MFRFPYFNFPFQYPYYKYYNTHYNSKNSKQNNLQVQAENKSQKSTEENTSSVQASNYNTNSSPFSFNLNGLNNMDDSILELFGINLYLDDIIILCLLFLLYKENVKDEMLFIALILLLLS